MILGDAGVGKTSLLITHATGNFPDEYVPTVFDGHESVVMCDGAPVTLSLWDISHGEDYDVARLRTCLGTHIFLLAFSCMDLDSMNRIQTKWHPEIVEYLPTVPYILVATKRDLREDGEAFVELEQRLGRGPTTWHEGELLSRQIGALAYMEVSAMTGEGVSELFNTALRAIYTRGLAARANAQNHRGRKLLKCTLL